ncbi:hypothetical protein [Vagococcus fluvialis]|uniref:hypothetical protein n=1 Tax=Vagococcus fluvialis TaxID=2738 RepID=UPI0037D296C1
MLERYHIAIRKVGFLLFSWLLIYFTTSLFFDKTSSNFNLLLSILSFVCYLLIPFFLQSQKDYKNYLNSIFVRINLTSFIISFFYSLSLLLSLAIHYKLQMFDSITQQLKLNMDLPIILTLNLVLLGIIPSFFQQTFFRYVIPTSLVIFYFIDQPVSILITIVLLVIFSCFLTQYTASIFPSILFHFTLVTGLTYCILGGLLISTVFLLFIVTKKSKRLE